MARFIMLVVRDDGYPDSRDGYNAVSLIRDALYDMQFEKIQGWQLQDMGEGIRNRDGVMEFEATPLAQSPNWNKLI